MVPTRDRRALLIGTLRSVLAQDAIDVEVLVVDDGSVDGSREAVLSLADPRVRVLRHDVPVGVARARNDGADASSGTWIALLDDDDLWAPVKLRRQVDAARKAGVRWAYAGAVEIDRDGRLLGGEPPPDADVLVSQLTRRNLMPAGSSNVLVRADAFREVGGFDVRLRHLADWDLWLRLAAIESPVCIAEPLVAYRIHPSQATLDTHGMMAEAALLHERHGADPVSIRRWLAWSNLRLGRRREAVGAYARAVASGDLGSAGRAVVAALHPHPTSLGHRAPSAADAAWAEAARGWLDAFTEER